MLNFKFNKIFFLSFVALMVLNVFGSEFFVENVNDVVFNYKYMVYTDYELVKYLNKLGPSKIIFDKKKREKFYKKIIATIEKVCDDKEIKKILIEQIEIDAERLMIDIFNFYQINMQRSIEKSFSEVVKTNTEEGYLQIFSETIQFMSTKEDQSNYLKAIFNRRALVEFLVKNKDITSSIEETLIEYKDNENTIKKFFEDEQKNRAVFVEKIIKGGRLSSILNTMKIWFDGFAKRQFSSTFFPSSIFSLTLANMFQDKKFLKSVFRDSKSVKNVYSIKSSELNSFKEIFYSVDIYKVIAKSIFTSPLYVFKNQILDGIMGVSAENILNPFRYPVLSQVPSAYNLYRSYCLIYSSIYIYGIIKSLIDLNASINLAKKYNKFFDLFNEKIRIALKLYNLIKNFQNINVKNIPEVLYFENTIEKNRNNLKLEYPSIYNPYNVFLRDVKDVADEFSIKLRNKVFDINIKENFYKKRSAYFDFSIERFIGFFDALVSKVKLYQYVNNNEEFKNKFSIPEYLVSNSNQNIITENPELKIINGWRPEFWENSISNSLILNKNEKRNLFIVGPTKSGKTEIENMALEMIYWGNLGICPCEKIVYSPFSKLFAMIHLPYIANESKNSTENLYLRYILNFIEKNDDISFIVYDELFSSTTEEQSYYSILKLSDRVLKNSKNISIFCTHMKSHLCLEKNEKNSILNGYVKVIKDSLKANSFIRLFKLSFNEDDNWWFSENCKKIREEYSDWAESVSS